MTRRRCCCRGNASDLTRGNPQFVVDGRLLLLVPRLTSAPAKVVGLKYGLEVAAPVDNAGRFTEEAEFLYGFRSCCADTREHDYIEMRDHDGDDRDLQPTVYFISGGKISAEQSTETCEVGLASLVGADVLKDPFRITLRSPVSLPLSHLHSASALQLPCPMFVCIPMPATFAPGTASLSSVQPISKADPRAFGYGHSILPYVAHPQCRQDANGKISELLAERGTLLLEKPYG